MMVKMIVMMVAHGWTPPRVVCVVCVGERPQRDTSFDLRVIHFAQIQN